MSVPDMCKHVWLLVLIKISHLACQFEYGNCKYEYDLPVLDGNCQKDFNSTLIKNCNQNCIRGMT